jgi:DHA2 family multidrug resistance protein
MRNLGASIGIALLSTAVQVREQIHFSTIAEALSQNSLRLQERVAALVANFAAHGSDTATATQRAYDIIANQARLNASVMAYADAFWVLGACILVSMLTVLILKKPDAKAAAAAAEAAGH